MAIDVSVAWIAMTLVLLGGCGGRPPGRLTIPIEPERVPMAMACAKSVLQEAGGFIGARGETATRIDARIVREISADEREVDLIAFSVTRSVDNSMLVASVNAASRDEHGNPASPGQFFFIEKPIPRASAQAISKRLQACESPAAE